MVNFNRKCWYLEGYQQIKMDIPSGMLISWLEYHNQLVHGSGTCTCICTYMYWNNTLPLPFTVIAIPIWYIMQWAYRQPNKIMAYLTFHKWLVSVCNFHNDIMNGTNQNQSLGKSELRYYFIRLTIYIHTFTSQIWIMLISTVDTL